MPSTDETSLLEIQPDDEERTPLVSQNSQTNGATASFTIESPLVKLTHFIHNERQPSWFERGHNPISLLSSAISVIPLIDPIHQIAKAKSYPLAKEWLFITGTCGANFLLNFVFLKDFLEKFHLLIRPDLKKEEDELNLEGWSYGKIAFVSISSTIAASVMAALPLSSNLADHPPAQYIVSVATLFSYIGLKTYSLAPIYNRIAKLKKNSEEESIRESASLKIANFKKTRAAVERLMKKGEFNAENLDNITQIAEKLNTIFKLDDTVQTEVNDAQAYQVNLGIGFNILEKLLWLGIGMVLISYTYGAYLGLLALIENANAAWPLAGFAIFVFGTLVCKASSEILEGSIQIGATVYKKLKEKENLANPLNPISWPKYLLEGGKIGIEESSTYSMNHFYWSSLILRTLFTGLCLLSFSTTTSLQEEAADDPDTPFGFMKSDPILWNFIYGLTIFVPDYFNYFCVSRSVTSLTNRLLSLTGQANTVENQKFLDTLDRVIANLEIAIPENVNEAFRPIIQPTDNIESLIDSSSSKRSEIGEEETIESTATNSASFFSGFKRYFCCDMDNSEEYVPLTLN